MTALIVFASFIAYGVVGVTIAAVFEHRLGIKSFEAENWGIFWGPAIPCLALAGVLIAIVWPFTYLHRLLSGYLTRPKMPRATLLKKDGAA